MRAAASGGAVPLDLARPGRYHVVGVGGPGMSAIALVLAGMGHRVSGSDLRDTPVLDRLRAAGIDVHVGHDRSLVHGVDAVTYPTGMPERNIELVEARQRGLTVLHRSGVLASICARGDALGVAGTHGKTTTTSMLAMILSEAGFQPSFVVGGDLNDVGSGAHWGAGRWVVVEADESDGTFLELPLLGAIVTNVEVDHLDHYADYDAIVEAFDRYLGAVEGPKVACLDDAGSAALAARHDAITYGTHPSARVRAVDIVVDRGMQTFAVVDGGTRLGTIRLPLRGVHNVRNATAAIALAMAVGAPFDSAARSLARFGGVARRFDFRGEVDGITFVDDYGHIPTEIAAVLEAAATSGDGWRRVVAVFQPNRYSRMAVLSPDYGDSFALADLVVITDIYPSGEPPRPGVTGKLVVNAVLDRHPFQRVAWLPRRHDLIEYLARELRPGDLCLSMGCGDIASLPAEVMGRLAELAGSR